MVAELRTCQSEMDTWLGCSLYVPWAAVGGLLRFELRHGHDSPLAATAWDFQGVMDRLCTSRDAT